MARDENPRQETRNDDPLVQEQQREKATGEKDQAEGERGQATRSKKRTLDHEEPRGDRIHDARDARRPGGGRKGQPR